jgi:hypothetical protein
VYFCERYSVAMRNMAGFVRPSRTMRMRVFLASEVDATKLTGAPSRDLNSGTAGCVAAAAAAVVSRAGVGAVFGTR